MKIKLIKKKIDKKEKQIKVENKIGDKKVKIRFAFYPIRIDNNTLVWLEKYISVYKYCIIDVRKYYKMVNISIPIYGWKLIERKIKNEKT